LADLRLPSQFEAVAEYVTPQDVAEKVRVSHDLEQHADWIREVADIGFEAIYLHNVNKRQDEFIRAFGEHVLPKLKGAI
jgi:coenzyme F420-dependent glucose-6-phosphate dehydrogenase